MSSITLKREENAAVLKVDTRFYGRMAVVVAAAEFAEHFWIQLDGNPAGGLMVRLTPKSGDIDLESSAREFFNYMVALMDESVGALSEDRPQDLLSAQPVDKA